MPGVWIGLTVGGLLSGIGMVQLRCKTGAYPCGDWPRHGFTWHFLVVFALFVMGWWLLTRRSRSSFNETGLAMAPMLGLAVAFSWYGLTGAQFHAPICDTPILCHDAMRGSIIIWSSPWLILGAVSISRLLSKKTKNPEVGDKRS